MNFNYRYPGSSPFEDNDYDRMLFFGRDREKQALFHLVMSERLSVLFAKSGIGKTSLIHAGINQMFRDKGFIPLVIRFHADYADPFDAVYKTIEDIAKREKKEYISGKQGSLWEYFKTVEFWTSEDVLLSPVVIFDQFEEFFAVYPPEKRKEFIRQLADLVRNRIPAELRQPETPIPYSETPPDVKILIAIREDYLGLLEELADDIPHIFQNRFRLLPLTKEQAKEAIIKPAELTDERIQTPNFRYEDDALDAILEYLCKRKERDGVKIINEVESFQLQLICRHIEENKISEKSDKQQIVIAKQDLIELSVVLQKFYEDQLNLLEKKDRENVIRLCEEGLISVSDRRLSLEQEEIERKFKVSILVLEKLVNSRLLRAESRVGSVYYELSHDTLIEPIRNVQKMTQQRNYIVICTTVVCIILILPILAYYYYDHSKKYDEAIAAYKKAIELNTKFASSYNGLDTAYSDMKRYDEAIATYKKAIELDPKFASSYNGLGAVYYHLKRYDEAIAAYKKAIELDPKSSSSYNNLGAAYSDMKKCDEAIAAYKKAIELDPKFAPYYNNLGAAYSDMKKYDEAIAEYKKAIELDPKFASCYNGLGAAYYHLKRYDEAITEYKKAIELDPKFIAVYNNLGAVYFDLKKYDEAITKYRKAIELDPKSASSYSGLGATYSDLKRNEDAIAAYKEAIELDPKSASSYNGLGAVYYYLKRYDEAIAMYRKAIELDPKFASAYNNLGTAYSDLKRYDEAITEYKKAIELDPKFALAYNSLGTAYYYLKRYDEAIGAYKKAIELDPKFVSAYNNLGAAYSDLEKHEARGAYKSPKPEADRKMKEIDAEIK